MKKRLTRIFFTFNLQCNIELLSRKISYYYRQNFFRTSASVGTLFFTSSSKSGKYFFCIRTSNSWWLSEAEEDVDVHNPFNRDTSSGSTSRWLLHELIIMQRHLATARTTHGCCFFNVTGSESGSRGSTSSSFVGVQSIRKKGVIFGEKTSSKINVSVFQMKFETTEQTTQFL